MRKAIFAAAAAFCLVGLSATGAEATPATRPVGGAAVGPLSITQADRAGYAVSAPRVHRISASWIQPLVTCGSKTTYSTFQVSVSGGGSPFRVGTALECHDGRAVSYAFVGGPGRGMPEVVKPGDRITADIRVERHGVAYGIENVTQGWGAGGASGSSGPGPRYATGAVLVAARTTKDGHVLPVTRFPHVTFRGCHVNGVAIGLGHPRRIVMHTPSGGLARPSGLVDHKQFTVNRPGV